MGISILIVGKGLRFVIWLQHIASRWYAGFLVAFVVVLFSIQIYSSSGTYSS